MSFLKPLAVASFALIVGLPVPARADVTWPRGEPIFHRDSRGPTYWGPRQYYSGPWFSPGWGYEPRRRAPQVRSGGARPTIAAKAPETVAFPNHETPGTVIIDTANRALYYTLSETEAYKYPVAVGREGFAWTGTETISRVANWPDWYPPEEMRQRDRRLPVKMTGGVNNPLGVKALYLGDTLYRIHGTNDSKSIGSASSSGCFRMLNGHVVHLASVAGIGTTVKVVKRWPPEGYTLDALPERAPTPDGSQPAPDGSRKASPGADPGTLTEAAVQAPTVPTATTTGDTSTAASSTAAPAPVNVR